MTTILIKVPILVDKKKNSQKVNNYDYDNSDNSDSKSEPRSPKFTNFLLLINQDVPSNLQLQF